MKKIIIILFFVWLGSLHTETVAQKRKTNRTSVSKSAVKYDSVGKYCNGLAKVSLNKKWGYIDKTRKVVIPIQYTDAWDFVDGLAGVTLGKEWFVIDLKGKSYNLPEGSQSLACTDEFMIVLMNKWKKLKLTKSGTLIVE